MIPFDLPLAIEDSPAFVAVNMEGETAEDILAEIQASLSLGCLSLD